MFKCPTVLDYKDNFVMSFRMPKRYKALLERVGEGNASLGMKIILYTFEEKTIKYLDKIEAKKNKIIAKNSKVKK